MNYKVPFIQHFTETRLKIPLWKPKMQCCDLKNPPTPAKPSSYLHKLLSTILLYLLIILKHMAAVLSKNDYKVAI